jgi:DNA modification methylase
MAFERVDLSEDVTLYRGDCLEVLSALPEASVHCAVTSPPYYGLRDYGTGQWQGGDPECDHKMVDDGGPKQLTNRGASGHVHRNCSKCGAVRIDDQIGLEETPEAYVERLVDVFREVWRVLRDDGTVWLNLGDSYASGEIGRHDSVQGREIDGKPVTSKAESRQQIKLTTGLKPKDLVGIPWRVAFALQADGWYLRQDIIWAKPNPMPESVTDRCTKAHEYIFLLSKSARYYYDQEAVKEPFADERMGNPNGGGQYSVGSGRNDHGALKTGKWNEDGKAMGRNRRSVWTISTQPYSGAHFATFPPYLIEPMILAGCPALCCPVCGKGWERVVESSSVLEPGRKVRGLGPKTEGIQRLSSTKLHEIKTTTTLGFRPTCDCGALDHVPGVVLDPFGGSGTTAEVAIKHGRKAVLIELNAEYVELQRERLAKVLAQPPLFRLTPLQADAARHEQAELFEPPAAQLKHGS